MRRGKRLGPYIAAQEGFIFGADSEKWTLQKDLTN
jgi:hypothetical protein